MIPRNTGIDADGIAQTGHFEKSVVGGGWFEMRDLAQGAYHLHDDSEIELLEGLARRLARVRCTETPA